MSITQTGTFTLTLFTNSLARAAEADAAGIERIGVDLESIGKAERQGHLNTWISDHVEGDLVALRPSVRQSRLFARCNPPHPGFEDEIERLLALGANVLMLPYFHRADEARRFVAAVAGRATTVLLIETAPAAALTVELCRIPGVDEIHFGLNDLRLSLGWPSHFHVLVSPELERWCAEVHAACLPCAVGGVGRAGDNDLPIPADLVYAQLARLRATGSLVSRAFFRAWNHDLTTEVRRARATLKDYSCASRATLDEERSRLASLIGA